MASLQDPYEKLLDLAEDRAYRSAVDLCFSILDDGRELDRAFWTLQIGLLHFLNFWENGTLFEEAPRFTEQALFFDPSNADAHFWHGHVVEVSFRDMPQAEGEYANCLAIDPGHVYAHLALGGILTPAEARDHLQQVTEKQPGNLRALMLLASCSQQLGETGTAIAAYERVLATEPYVETAQGVMNRYINTELNFATLADGVRQDAHKKLAAIRRPRG